jgi:fluoride ion exporter CrcB/FEX
MLRAHGRSRQRLLGAYTTFSAFAYETQELIREAQIALVAGNAVGCRGNAM